MNVVTGIHFVLFCICTYILSRSKGLGSMQWFNFASALVMFTTSTANILITFRLTGHDARLLFGADFGCRNYLSGGGCSSRKSAFRSQQGRST